MRNSIKGLIVGALLGAIAGLGTSVALNSEPVQLAGATLGCALLCGACGYAHGDEFFEWLKDNWDSFL